jgi:gentisate 1,2-dioxygenase
MAFTVADCEDLRRKLKPLTEAVADLVRVNPSPDAEACANVMLAYRHLEDASMRLGKSIQALNGGVSVYDITQVPKSA